MIDLFWRTLRIGDMKTHLPAALYPSDRGHFNIVRLTFRRDGDASGDANGERLVRRMRSEASFLGSEPREDGFDDFHAVQRVGIKIA